MFTICGLLQKIALTPNHCCDSDNIPLSLDAKEELPLSLSLCHSKQGFDGRGEDAVFDGQWANASAQVKDNSNLRAF